jgi:hypothetical protein
MYQEWYEDADFNSIEMKYFSLRAWEKATDSHEIGSNCRS